MRKLRVGKRRWERSWVSLRWPRGGARAEWPISEVLLAAPRLEGNGSYGYETGYGKLINLYGCKCSL
jgi:hypothetical protein